MFPALALIAASAGLNYMNNRDAERRRERLRSAMEDYQRRKAREQESAVQQLIEQQTPEAREAESKEVREQSAESMRDLVGASMVKAAVPAGKVSNEYRAAEETAANTVAERTRRAIEQLSAMRAPQEVARRHSIRFGRSAGEVDAATRASENVGRGYMMDIENVRPNPWLSMISQIGMGAGVGMAGRPSAGLNNGQGYEDASGNLYDPNVAPRLSIGQRLARGLGLFGGG